MRNLVIVALLLLLLNVSAFQDNEITGNMDALNNVPSLIKATDSPVTVNATFQIRNPDPSSMEIYLVKREDGGWTPEKDFGAIAAGGESQLNLTLPIKYSGQSNDKITYGLVGQTSQGVWLDQFDINIDWSAFEGSLLATLTAFSFTLVPLAIIALIVIAIVVFVLAYKRKHDEVRPGEYGLYSLLFPFRMDRPIKENIADLIFNVFFWILALGVLGLLALYILANSLTLGGIGIWVFLVAGILAIAPPAVYAVLAWASEIYEREPVRFLVSMFAWGLFALSIAFIVNTTIALILGAMIGPEITTIITAVIVAPMVEETSKGLGVLIASGHHEMRGIYDGMLYGFLVGMGFAAGENWLYFAANASPAVVGVGGWGWLMLQRSMITAVGHGIFTGTTGLALGLGKRFKIPFAGLAFVPGVIGAMILHGSFNFSALLDGLMNYYNLFPFPVFDPVIIMVAGGIFLIIAFVALRDRKSHLVN